MSVTVIKSAQYGPKDSHEARDCKRCHDRVANVFIADHAAVKQSKARHGHHQHKGH